MQNFQNDIATSSARELNNLLQIIGGTTHLLENIWAGNPNSEKYLAMLRASVERAADVTAHLVSQRGGARENIVVCEKPAAWTGPGEQERGQRPRIMVVDDDAVGLELFDELLSRQGYDVTTARSGFECLDLFVRRAGQFDLVLLDLTMPFMEGDETFRRLRAIAPNVKVALATWFIRQDRLDALLAEGLAGFLHKPLPAQELVAIVASIVRSEQEPARVGIASAT